MVQKFKVQRFRIQAGEGMRINRFEDIEAVNSHEQ